METTRATWRFTAIRGLLSIGAFERLAAGPLTIGELAERCGANAEILRRVLRCVAATGLLRSAGPQRYELTDACRAAMDGWAFAGLLFNADPEIWNALGDITETIRTGTATLIDFITAILQANRGVRGILTELDRALPGARTHLAANGLAVRMTPASKATAAGSSGPKCG